jgi:hypothetical protein
MEKQRFTISLLAVAVHQGIPSILVECVPQVWDWETDTRADHACGGEVAVLERDDLDPF